ncbi:MAG: carboxylating nicotinate-nucleotide diphosphorylase [Egibacteraceae bacterium]
MAVERVERVAGLADVIAAALAEDLGEAGDVTTLATVPAEAVAAAALVARQAGVVAGLEAARAVFAAVDPRVEFTACVHDGARVEPGAVLAQVRGPARAMLTGERTALNLLCHLSGVATATAAFVDELEGTGCAVRDTRKTLPGLRALQKAAVAAGGGVNHRMGLSDALLVKDNHVHAAGGVVNAVSRALAAAGGRDVQVEVDSLEQLDEALEAGARSVLLDNFCLNDLHAAVARCRRHDGPVFIEASGGVTLASAWAIASTGVDAIAVGALTHSAAALDIGLDFTAQPEPCC